MDDQRPALSKVTVIAGTCLIGLSPLATTSQELVTGVQTIGSVILTGNMWYFSTGVKKLDKPSVDPSIDSKEYNDQNAIEVPEAFDEWAQGQIVCHDKMCPVSDFYMFNVMVIQYPKKLCVDQRFLDKCKDEKISYFRFNGDHYAIDDFVLDRESSQLNCKFYKETLYPMVWEILKRNEKAQKPFKILENDHATIHSNS